MTSIRNRMGNILTEITIISERLAESGRYPPCCSTINKNGDPDAWIEALQEYLSLDAELLVLGHGPVGRRENVVELLEYMKNVREAMKKMIASGRTDEEILKAGDEVAYYISGFAKPSALKRWHKVWQACVLNE